MHKRFTVRCGLTPEGNIEAAFRAWHDGARVVIEPRYGNVIHATVKQGTDEWRWLLDAARKAWRTR